MSTIRTRAAKGSALTHAEVDANFKRPSTQKTTTYQVVVGDNRSTIEGNHASTPFTITLPTVAAAGAAEPGDFRVTITNINAAVVTVDGSGAETIDGAANIALNQWESITVELDSAAAAWKVVSAVNIAPGALAALGGMTSGGNVVPDTDSTDDLGATGTRWKDTYTDTITVTDTITLGAATVNPPTLGTEQATTSGTDIDFTSVPSWVQKITINFVSVSTSGTDVYLVQIGDSGGIEATGYLGTGAAISNATSPSVNAPVTNGWLLLSGSAGNVWHGSIVLTLEDAANFTWICSGQLAASSGAALLITAGSKSLSAALDRVRITTENGTDTFDAGAINVLYE